MITVRCLGAIFPMLTVPVAGTKYKLPGIDSINLWGYISGVEQTSPRTEIAVCIDMPLMNGTSSL